MAGALRHGYLRLHHEIETLLPPFYDVIRILRTFGASKSPFLLTYAFSLSFTDDDDFLSDEMMMPPLLVGNQSIMALSEHITYWVVRPSICTEARPRSFVPLGAWASWVVT